MPKKAKDVSPIPPKELDALMDEIWAVYPDRDLPHLFIPARLAVAEQLAAGATTDDLVRAARRYRDMWRGRPRRPGTSRGWRSSTARRCGARSSR